jgi:hypothetical protein
VSPTSSGYVGKRMGKPASRSASANVVFPARPGCTRASGVDVGRRGVAIVVGAGIIRTAPNCRKSRTAARTSGEANRPAPRIATSSASHANRWNGARRVRCCAALCPTTWARFGVGG